MRLAYASTESIRKVKEIGLLSFHSVDLRF
jgi:hypothetical protein